MHWSQRNFREHHCRHVGVSIALKKPSTVRGAEDFGRIRVSKNFFMREFLHSVMAGGSEVDTYADEIFKKREVSGLDDYAFATKLIGDIDVQ